MFFALLSLFFVSSWGKMCLSSCYSHSSVSNDQNPDPTTQLIFIAQDYPPSLSYSRDVVVDRDALMVLVLLSNSDDSVFLSEDFTFRVTLNMGIINSIYTNVEASRIALGEGFESESLPQIISHSEWTVDVTGSFYSEITQEVIKDVEEQTSLTWYSYDYCDSCTKYDIVDPHHLCLYQQIELGFILTFVSIFMCVFCCICCCCCILCFCCCDVGRICFQKKRNVPKERVYTTTNIITTTTNVPYQQHQQSSYTYPQQQQIPQQYQPLIHQHQYQQPQRPPQPQLQTPQPPQHTFLQPVSNQKNNNHNNHNNHNNNVPHLPNLNVEYNPVLFSERESVNRDGSGRELMEHEQEQEQEQDFVHREFSTEYNI